jgi:hypothetical protein
MSWRKGALFSFSEVIVDTSIEDKFSDWDERIVCLGNNFCDIKDVPFIVVAVSLGNDLNF